MSHLQSDASPIELAILRVQSLWSKILDTYINNGYSKDLPNINVMLPEILFYKEIMIL